MVSELRKNNSGRALPMRKTDQEVQNYEKRGNEKVVRGRNIVVRKGN